MAKIIKAEYIWLDGGAPTQELRSKTKIIPLSTDTQVELRDFPEWGYDGSSTYQAEGGDSDLSLRPVNFVHDPLRGSGSYLVMCEVLPADGAPHESNVRAELRRVLDAGAHAEQAWFGFEQEYTFFAEQTPLGFPEGGYPAPQGPYYCGIGADNAFGREIVEEHIDACTEAGLMIFGVNAEVMPGQWEFQMGYRGDKSEDPTSLNVCDHLWFARWMLHRIAEERGVKESLDCKPMRGDWNGAGMHTNFSTRDMRDPSKGAGGIEKMKDEADKLGLTLSGDNANAIAAMNDGMTNLKNAMTGVVQTILGDMAPALA